MVGYIGKTKFPVIKLHINPNTQTVIINSTANRKRCCGVMPKNLPEDLRFLGAGRGACAGGFSSGKNSTGSSKPEVFEASLRSPSNMSVFYHSDGRR